MPWRADMMGKEEGGITGKGVERLLSQVSVVAGWGWVGTKREVDEIAER